MKLKLLFLTIFCSVAIANAQYTVTNDAGDVLQDGDIINSTLMESYNFFVTNDNPSEEIYTRIEVVSLVNTTGDLFEFCYGLCLPNVFVGLILPEPPSTMAIGVGETTIEGNHFLNGDSGDGTQVIDYVFIFHQYEDAAGDTETGTPLTLTYRYNPNLGVSDNSKVDLTIESTVITNELVLKVNEPVNMMVYDLQGRIVKQARFETGRQTLDMSNLNSQAYILQFRNEKGATQTSKIIVK